MRDINDENENKEIMMPKQIQPMTLTPEDELLIAAVQERDLAPPGPKLIALLQNNSAKLLEKVKGSKAGDYAVPVEGLHLLCKATVGVPHVPVGYERFYVEWAPNRGGYVDKHLKKPADACWLKANEFPDRKQGFWLGNGNKLEDTIFAHLLVLLDGRDPFGATFPFRSTALNIGLDYENQAERIKLENPKLGGARRQQMEDDFPHRAGWGLQLACPRPDSRGCARPAQRPNFGAGASRSSTASGLQGKLARADGDHGAGANPAYTHHQRSTRPQSSRSTADRR